MDMVVSRESVQYIVTTHLGALPGRDVPFLLYPQAETTVPEYTPRQSEFRSNNTDLLYLRDDVARISFVEQAAGPFVLGGDALAAFGRPWGVCESVLYTNQMPRKCFKGEPIRFVCPIASCPVSFLATQHVVSSCSDSLVLGHNFTVISDGCTKRVSVRDTELPAVIVAPGAPPQASLWQLGASVQYNPTTFEMSVWVRDPEEGHVEGVVTTAILIAFLAIWLTWTRDLNAAIFSQTSAALEATWTQVAVGAMITFDAVTFSGSIKAWYLITDADVFTPPTVDLTYGGTFSEWYCQFFVIVALVLVGITAVILGIMAATRGEWMPSVVSGWLTPGMAFVGGPPGRAKATLPREKLVLLVLLRWVVELIVLTALHIAIPTRLGVSFQTAVGLGIGVSLALVAGRDTYIILHEISRSFWPLRRSPTGAFALFCLAYTIGHVAIFMVLPTFASTETLTPAMSIACSWSLAVQAACAGVVLCKQAYGAGEATNTLL